MRFGFTYMHRLSCNDINSIKNKLKTKLDQPTETPSETVVNFMKVFLSETRNVLILGFLLLSY